jgi:hypothetical protein
MSMIYEIPKEIVEKSQNHFLIIYALRTDGQTERGLDMNFTFEQYISVVL